MATIGSLVAELKLNSAAFIRGLSGAERAMKSETAQMRKHMRGVQRAARGVGREMKKMARSVSIVKTAFAGLGAALVLKKIIDTSVEFQNLQSSLITVTGGIAQADKAFALIKEFAATTPFDLKQVTGAFIKLKALGMDPSAKALRSYGNTASAMGKSLNQMIEAVADAATGEFERLKEFGIKSKSEGDKVTFTFQGVSTQVGKNAAEIEGFLRKIGDIQFAGAMERQAKTIGGALSNLGDAFAIFQNEIGKGGFAQAIADVARELSAATNGSKSLAREIGAALGSAVRGTAVAVRLIANNMRELTAALAAMVALKMAGIVLGLAQAFIALAVAMRAAWVAGGLFASVMAGMKKGLLGIAAAAAAFAGVMFLFKKSGPALEEAKQALADLTAASQGAAAGTTAAATAITKSTTALELESKQLGQLISALKISTLEYEKMTRAIALENEAARLGAEPNTTLGEAWLAAAVKASKLKDNLKSLLTTQARAKAIVEGMRTPQEVQNALMEEAAELYDKGALSAAELARRQKQIIEDGSEANEIGKQLGLTFSSAFESAVVEGKKFSEVLRSLARDLLKLIVRKAATEPLASAASTAISAGLSNIFGNIPARAHGGPVSAGEFYKVGERGPELFAPGRDGTIIPNNKLGGGGGGGGNTYYIDARGADVGAVDRLQRALISLAGPGKVEQRAIAAVGQRNGRNPAFLGA